MKITWPDQRPHAVVVEHLPPGSCFRAGDGDELWLVVAGCDVDLANPTLTVRAVALCSGHFRRFSRGEPAYPVKAHVVVER